MFGSIRNTATVLFLVLSAVASPVRGDVTASGDYWPNPLHSGDGVVNSEMQLGFPFLTTASVNVTGGSTLTTKEGVYLGASAASTGNVTVTNATWSAESAVFVAAEFHSFGTVTLIGSAWTMPSNVALARGEGATATVNVSNSLWTADALVTVGGLGFSDNNGWGRVNIASGGSVVGRYGLNLTPRGRIELDGGTLALYGTSRLEGTLSATANGGTVRLYVGPMPGGLGFAELSDDVDLTGCNLDIVFRNGYVPNLVSTFNLFDPLDGADLATILGRAATVTAPANWQLDQSTGVLSAVPEPATLALPAAGLTALAARRRGRVK